MLISFTLYGFKAWRERVQAAVALKRLGVSAADAARACQQFGAAWLKVERPADGEPR